MRVAAVGLMALPVIAGGLGIAAAVVVLGPLEATAPTNGRVVNEVAAPVPVDPGDLGGTDIEGSKPHLTVRDGATMVRVPGTMPGFLSLLPEPEKDLPPLAPAAGRWTNEIPIPPSAEQAPSPATDTTPDEWDGGGTDARATIVGGPPTGAADSTSARDPDAPRTTGNRPPHAADTGVPDHAGIPGPPSHASADSRGYEVHQDTSRSDNRSSPE
ncbi:hypothetical protein [Dietzia sp. PP-33]|jgi:hypothetical protein|uniref:hypothetical protein n=1 Tax=Dietzia sp. PP-33 TaxID=2957500 RepID=UPI0029A22AA0|nr:hypothetical protein [Dietzia sp. PP-33]MDX2356328.1 hypothetical protein [Dietzia sp. PP-33]